jgi:hypothetical protein
MIKLETDTVQPADERYTGRRQMRTAQKAARRDLRGKG